MLKALADLCNEMKNEFYSDIVPFWTDVTINPENDEFWSTISNDLRQRSSSPKSVINFTRLLWSYASWYRFDGDPRFLKFADKIYNILKDHFWDPENQGVFWSLDDQYQVLDDKKRVYGHSFFIYSMSEYYAASKDPKALELAQKTFYLLEDKISDREYMGYFETFNRDWSIASDLRLSDKDMNEKKSMNSHLHIMEAYTNLYRVWPDPKVKEKLYELLHIFTEYIIDPVEKRFKLFFDEKWECKSPYTSYGHDIEGSWLLWETIEVLDDVELQKNMKPLVIQMAQRVLETGFDQDGGLFYEGKGKEIVDSDKHWWPQAEAIVGFINAWQLTENPEYAEMAIRCWEFTKAYIIDRQHGEWFWKVSRDRVVYMDTPKVTDWKGPYHNSRACMEIIKRLSS